MTCSPIPYFYRALFGCCLLLTSLSSVQAQPGCARCVSPATVLPLHQSGPILWSPLAPSRRPALLPPQDQPPVSSPYYSADPENSEAGEVSLFAPVRRSAPRSLPTERSRPMATEIDKPDRQQPLKVPDASQPTVIEKIGQRYSDPRVIRMLQQLTREQSKSFFIEVSDLIDSRHLNPATYAQRVDHGLEHLIQGLDVPAFITAAQVQGTGAEIAVFQGELRELRTRLNIRNQQDALATLNDVQHRAAQSLALNPAAVSLEFLYGATDSLDPYSMLLPPEKSGGPSVGLRDTMVGIGVEIESHPAGLKILKPLPGGPAFQADLRVGDIITHVDGHELKSVEINRAVDLILGPAGLPIKIQALRGDRSGVVTLLRQKFAVQSIVDVRIQESSQGIGYLKLEQFAESTTQELDQALMKLHRQGMKSLILDLRGNPGGLLTTAISVSDRFLSGGTIVATRGRTPDDHSVEAAHSANTWKMPLVVLLDRKSASASEIFAAAIQDHHRGLIIGEKSYGKGTVQTLFPLQTFPAALRLTTAKFYSPEGREMSGTGVTPDIKVDAGQKAEIAPRDQVLDAALRQLVGPRKQSREKRIQRSGAIVNPLIV